MTTEQVVVSVSLPAGADLSAAANQYLLLKLNTAQQVILATDGDSAIGVLGNLPASGSPAQINVGTIVKVKAGAAVTAGVLVSSDAAGKAVLAATGDFVFGQAIDAAAGVDELIRVIRLSNYDAA